MAHPFGKAPNLAAEKTLSEALDYLPDDTTGEVLAMHKTLNAALTALATDGDVPVKLQEANAAYLALCAMEPQSAVNILRVALLQAIKQNPTLLERMDFWSTIQTNGSEMYKQMLIIITREEADIRKGADEIVDPQTKEFYTFYTNTSVKLGGLLRRTDAEDPKEDLAKAEALLSIVIEDLDNANDVIEEIKLRGTAKYELSFVEFRRGQFPESIDLLTQSIEDAKLADDKHGELQGMNRRAVVRLVLEDITNLNIAKCEFEQIAALAGQYAEMAEPDEGLRLNRTRMNAQGRAVEVATTLVLNAITNADEKVEVKRLALELRGLNFLLQSNPLYEATKEEAGVQKQVQNAIHALDTAQAYEMQI